MDKINQLVAISDKYIVVLGVLFIIFIGISLTLIHISKQIKK